ncbi:MAG: tetraacyldisaccharide 4-kinase, partial [Candidatus Binatus sp.]|nr:tetraacyldisaccharide 4-kinase [Candidatus Binatus sp.]
SGLASPAGFHAMLRGAGADVIRTLEYPDHHGYGDADWNTIVEASRSADLIVTTEKDLVKLERFPFARDSLYALRLEVTMEPGDASALDELIFSRVKPLA